MPDVFNAYSHAADRVFRIAVALAPPSTGACRTGSVIVPTNLIAGRGAVGERREPGPGDPDAVYVLDIWIPGRR